ncbi:MAG: TonB-dependent receptor plug domain-containing protein [Bacteroidales bacterium]|jgi:hypothetical protein|nr:TonB-dependent receptor plug domain-containing protein [Bacteroidales bacterium]
MVRIKSIIIFVLCIAFSLEMHSQIILDSIVITAERPRAGALIYTPDFTKKMISLTGENDPIKFLFFQTGVSTGVEGTSSLFVRGGNNGNNRIELDGVPLFDSGHLMGLISSLPADIISEITSQKGGLPASRGDFTSSLTRISTKTLPEGHSVTISPFFAGAFSSGYILKQKKISYLAAGRYSPLGLLWKGVKAVGIADNIDLKPVSGDLFLKFNVPFSSKNNLSAGIYYSHDHVSQKDRNVNMAVKWGTRFAYGTWDFKPYHWLSFESKAYFHKYHSAQSQFSYLENIWEKLLSIDEEIGEFSIGVKGEVNYKNFTLITGFEHKEREFDCAGTLVRKKSSDNATAVYAHLYYVNRFLSINAGMRYTHFLKGMNDYHVAISGNPTNNFGIELTYDKIHQMTHLAEGGLVAWRDFIIPAYDLLPPELCTQYYMGGYYSGTVSRTIFKVTLGAYYKKMENVTSFSRAADLFFTYFNNWHDVLKIGRGTSKGFECSFSVTSFKFTANINYTLSKTDRIFEEINDGKSFPFQYDRRHVLNAIGSFSVLEKAGKKQTANINISYTSGGYATLPVARYEATELPFMGQLVNDGSLTEMTQYHLHSLLLNPSINGFHLPAYFRIDVGYNFMWKGNKSEIELTTGIANILNRRNASLIFYSNGYWRQLSVIPIMPTIGIKVSF